LAPVEKLSVLGGRCVVKQAGYAATGRSVAVGVHLGCVVLLFLP